MEAGLKKGKKGLSMQDETKVGDAIRTVSGNAFQRVVLDAAVPVAVEFMSYSCAHCHALESALQEVARSVAPEQLLCRVNVAQDPELAERYGVQGTPTLVMFRDGEEVARAEGPPPDVVTLLKTMQQAFE